MRFPLALLLCLLLAACPSSKPPQKNAESTSIPISAPQTESQASVPTPLLATDVTDVWSTLDAQGQVFDLVIFSDGQITTTWTKGREGAQGERGFWRLEGNRLIAMYDDGTSSVVIRNGDTYTHQSFPAEAPLSAPPSSTAPLHPADRAMAPFIGIWRLNREPDGSYQHIVLQSNGRAFSSVNGGTEGEWAATERGAECKWPDGWVDLIEQTSSGWQKRSFLGASMDTPTDISPAQRIGETRFVALPVGT